MSALLHKFILQFNYVPHPKKQSFYFPVEMLKEIEIEAKKRNRSMSWVFQRAWKMARLEIKKLRS